MDEKLGIYKTMLIENFLEKFGLVGKSDIKTVANQIRYKKSNAMKVDVNEGVVEIKRGVYKGNKGKVLAQCEHQLEVLILDDKYENIIVIDIDDIAYKYENVKITYLLV